MEKIEVFEHTDEVGGLLGILLICGGVCGASCVATEGIGVAVLVAPAAEVGAPVPV